jgi:cobalamin biosynthetic protein CobC
MPQLSSDDWAALPDQRALVELEAAAADAFGAAPSSVCSLPGSEIGIRLLAGLSLSGPAWIVEPTYSTYRDAWPDAQSIEAGQIGQVPSGATLILANPNNPDGRLWPIAELLELADRLASGGGMLIVDEAFVDVLPELSLCRHLAGRPNIAVLRSFGKFFGLGGVRLGFLVSTGAAGAGVRHRLGAWPVSAAAIRVGTQAYGDRKWADRMIARLKRDAERLDALLSVHQLGTRGGCPLFRLVEDGRAPRLFDGLARQGILTRPFAYRSDWLRLGLPGREADWKRLAAALPQALEERP